jgi:hypothetical protein
VIWPAESFAPIVYCAVAVAFPEVDQEFVIANVPCEPLPEDAKAQLRVPPLVFAAPTNALCVGLAATDASVEVAGAVRSATDTTTVSVSAAVEGRLMTIGVNDIDPARCDSDVPAAMLVASSIGPAARAGETDDRTPKPKAATATSATRLKVVFVDICFLSISRSREFPPLGFG